MTSWWSRLKAGLGKTRTRLNEGLTQIFTRHRVDEESLAALEDLLISADVGVEGSQHLIETLRQRRFGQEVSVEEIKAELQQAIVESLLPVEKSLSLDCSPPLVIFMVGANGSGKTTTIAKLAQEFQKKGKRVLLVAGDTFRAAAVDQLNIWAQRTGVPIVTAKTGADVAALAYDAITQAQRNHDDIVLIDTAGRLHNKTDLMAELQKVVRVVKKIDVAYPQETILVLDATIGQNAVVQVGTFQQAVGLTGLIVTKLDGTAKGGIVLALASQFKLPIYAIGVGESADDLRPFTAKDFSSNLLGLHDETSLFLENRSV